MKSVRGRLLPICTKAANLLQVRQSDHMIRKKFCQLVSAHVERFQVGQVAERFMGETVQFVVA